MKKFITLALLLSAVAAGMAQVLTIRDKSTGAPLEMVTLLSDKPYAFTTTNAKGQCEVKSFAQSSLIRISMLGYKTELLSFKALESAGFNLQLTPSAIQMDEVVVSASRWNQSRTDVAQKVVTIAPREVSLQNPQTAADLLGSSGKVFIQKSQQGGGSPMIRGFATNRLLYTVDGVRMNTAIFRAGNIQNVISLDPFATEHTEVLFGPGSVIYGSDALGGVMSFQTLTPQFSLTDSPIVSGKAVTRYSSANEENTGHFDINVGWQKWAFVTSISANKFGDLRMGSDGPDEYLRPFFVTRHDSVDVVVTNPDPRVQTPSGYSQMNMMQKVRFKPNDAWDFQYGFHYSETSDYARYDRHIRYKKGLPRYGEWYYGPQKWMMNNLNVEHHAHNLLFDGMTLRLAQQRFDESRVSRDINKPNREIRTEKVDAYSANLDFSKTLGTQNTLLYGAEWVLNHVTSTGLDQNIKTGESQAGPSRYPQSDWGSYALYLTDQYKPSEKITLQAGARYNQYVLDADFDTAFYPFPFVHAESNNGALTGSLGAVARVVNNLTMSINLATGFRSPNVDDMGKVFDSGDGIVVVPNPDLKAEYVYNAEAGVAWVIEEVVKVDLSAYITRLDNAMVRRDFTLNGLDSLMYDGQMSKVQALQNAAKADIWGVEAGVEVMLPAGFTLSSNINYQHGEEELDDGTTSPSRHAPPWYGVSRLTWQAPRINLQLYALYSGERKFADMPEEEKSKPEIYAVDADGNPWSPGWYTLNFKAMYQFADHLTVSAGMENLTDQRYRPYSSGIVAAGRNFVLSLKATF
jgi:hemoglobin/transferrin/lactoferrin receptor protein